MKQLPWILLMFVSLQHVCLAASEDTAVFCDPNGKDFYRNQQLLAWQPVAPERIVEADYHGRVFEARLPDKNQELFAYKVLMNIRGSASYVSVALLDRRQSAVDVKQLASQARMLLQDEARKVARERGAKEAFVTLASSRQDIVLWSWRSRWFFSVDASERFSVFEIAGTTVGYVCTFGSASALGEEAVPTYASVRTEVTVQRLPEKPFGKPRPAKFFQLAGVGNNRPLCEKVLDVFNEPGRYEGYDSPRWLLDNSHQIDFRSLSVPQGEAGAADSQYNFPDLEYLSVDIDADGGDEHVYRLNSILSSRELQRLMVVGVPLQSHPELLSSYAKRCIEIEASAECGQINTMIRYALRAPVPDRLAEEWAFTQQGIWNWTTMDGESQRLIYSDRNKARRNIGSSSGSYWSLYRLDAAVVAVAAPNIDFAPPELAVFVPGKQRNGGLQCVLMPVAWHK